MLKDGSIKTHIIKQYVGIDEQTHQQVSALDFFVAFELDEEFNEVIKSRRVMSFHMHHSLRVKRCVSTWHYSLHGGEFAKMKTLQTQIY